MDIVEKHLATIKKYSASVGKRYDVNPEDVESYCCLEFVKLCKKNEERYLSSSKPYMNGLIYNICVHGATEYKHRIHYTKYHLKKKTGKSITVSHNVDFSLWDGSPEDLDEFENKTEDYSSLCQSGSNEESDLKEFLYKKCCDTYRDRKVLDLIQEGKSVKKIAHILNVGERTVRNILNVIEEAFINGTRKP